MREPKKPNKTVVKEMMLKWSESRGWQVQECSTYGYAEHLKLDAYSLRQLDQFIYNSTNIINPKINGNYITYSEKIPEAEYEILLATYNAELDRYHEYLAFEEAKKQLAKSNRIEDARTKLNYEIAKMQEHLEKKKQQLIDIENEATGFN